MVDTLGGRNQIVAVHLRHVAEFLHARRFVGHLEPRLGPGDAVVPQLDRCSLLDLACRSNRSLPTNCHHHEGWFQGTGAPVERDGSRAIVQDHSARDRLQPRLAAKCQVAAKPRHVTS